MNDARIVLVMDGFSEYENLTDRAKLAKFRHLCREHGPRGSQLARLLILRSYGQPPTLPLPPANVRKKERAEAMAKAKAKDELLKIIMRNEFKRQTATAAKAEEAIKSYHLKQLRDVELRIAEANAKAAASQAEAAKLAPPPPAADDHTAYVLASKLLDNEVTTIKKLWAILEQNPSIRRQKPTKQRLEVHAGDWHKYLDQSREHGWSAADAEQVVQGVKAGVDQRKHEARRAKEQLGSKPGLLPHLLPELKKAMKKHR